MSQIGPYSADHLVQAFRRAVDFDKLKESLWESFATNLDLIHRTETDPLCHVNSNLFETPDSYRYDLEIPGVSIQDIKISHNSGTVTVEGSKRLQNEESCEGYHFVETSSGFFRRSFDLPDGSVPSTLRATYRDGVLSITVNKVQTQPEPEIQFVTITHDEPDVHAPSPADV